MSYPQVFVLSLVQGLTEFLPVSSSGHLVILQKLFGIVKPPIFFDIMVHLGTLGAIFFYFREELLKALKQTRVWGLIIFGTIPAGLAGLFLNKQIETLFNSLDLVGLALFVTAVLLFSTKWIKKPTKQMEKLSLTDAFVIGLFQALAILPGISRSGSTIVAGLWRKASQETAFRFSFYLVIPAILGALVLQIPGLIYSPSDYLGQGILGMVIAGVVGYGALKILENFLFQAKLWTFGIYCAILSLVALLV